MAQTPSAVHFKACAKTRSAATCAATPRWFCSIRRVRHRRNGTILRARASDSPLSFSIDMTVRDYELDSYRVVNNSVYLKYLQHVRDEWLKAVGFNPQAYADAGDALAVSRIDIRFLAPLRSGDSFTGTAQLSQISAARFVLAQQLIRHPNSSSDASLEVVDATVTGCFLNKDYKPIRLPADFRRLMQNES
ncbi:hypothetical protein WJX73_000028 [Symbiochloris irregularis]|uniref:Acyl-CoA thioesterase n=1 Tax=Symbiochloris irregularis TaxID=706552 RepID=A0AAW1PV33_9CHLO